MLLSVVVGCVVSFIHCFFYFFILYRQSASSRLCWRRMCMRMCMCLLFIYSFDSLVYILVSRRWSPHWRSNLYCAVLATIGIAPPHNDACVIYGVGIFISFCENDQIEKKIIHDSLHCAWDKIPLQSVMCCAVFSISFSFMINSWPSYNWWSFDRFFSNLFVRFISFSSEYCRPSAFLIFTNYLYIFFYFIPVENWLNDWAVSDEQVSEWIVSDEQIYDCITDVLAMR